eukprot:350472-Chlamydomonas_euryale.AAC.2
MLEPARPMAQKPRGCAHWAAHSKKPGGRAALEIMLEPARPMCVTGGLASAHGLESNKSATQSLWLVDRLVDWLDDLPIDWPFRCDARCYSIAFADGSSAGAQPGLGPLQHLACYRAQTDHQPRLGLLQHQLACSTTAATADKLTRPRHLSCSTCKCCSSTGKAASKAYQQAYTLLRSVPCNSLRLWPDKAASRHSQQAG